MIDIVCFSGKPLDLGFTQIFPLAHFKSVATSHEDLLKNTLLSKRVDFIYNLEKTQKEDKVNRRSSGLNQVYAKLAHDKNIAVAFNFNLVLHAENKIIILGRMLQNVRFCRKYKVNMILASFATHPYDMRAPQDILAFGRCIGMTGKEAQDALNFSKKLPALRQDR